MLDWMVDLLRALTSAPCSGESPEELKNRGNEHFANGALDEAAHCYRQAIAIDPNYAEAYNNLGHLCRAQGKDEEAKRHLSRAIELRPDLAKAHYNLGKLHQKAGCMEQAIASFETTLSLSSNNAEALYSLAELYHQSGRDEEAVSCLRRAVEADPDSARAHYSFAMMLRLQGATAEATAHFNRAIALAPDFVEAYFELGNVLRDRKQLDSAAVCYEKAIGLQPTHALAHHGLGLVSLMQERQDEAATCFQAAIDADPGLPAAHMSLAEVLQKQGKLGEASLAVEKAIELAPDVAESHIVKALILKDQGAFEESERCFRHVLALKPEMDSARFAMSTVLLAGGKYVEGWELFDCRFYEGSLTQKRDFGHPEWAGEDLRDKGIVVWGDQGVGDEILFANVLADIMARTRRCVIECAYKLVPLFAQSFPEAIVVPKMDPPHPATRDVDYQISAAAAAGRLRRDLANFPNHDGYLRPDPSRLAYWTTRLAALGPGLKVGFAWRSNLTFGQRGLHYTTLDQWGPIFAVPGIHFVCLQYDRCTDELAAARKRFGIPLHAFEEVNLFDDLAEAAALKKALDLVVSAPTATAFLSAALGVPTWMTGYATPWQMLGSDRMPWFPAMRSFPRRWDQSREEVISAIARELRSYEAARPTRAIEERQDFRAC